jgi:hypothetical protein
LASLDPPNLGSDGRFQVPVSVALDARFSDADSPRNCPEARGLLDEFAVNAPSLAVRQTTDCASGDSAAASRSRSAWCAAAVPPCRGDTLSYCSFQRFASMNRNNELSLRLSSNLPVA